jgi:hypothetical protein
VTQFARNGDVALAFDIEGEGDDLLLIAGTGPGSRNKSSPQFPVRRSRASMAPDIFR